MDPVTKRRMYLTETVDTMAHAQRARTRLLNQVDERRNPRTTATISQLIDRWLEVVDVEPSTRQGYERKIGKHIRPVLGGLQVGRLDAEILESFYADLHRCREHCAGRRFVEPARRLLRHRHARGGSAECDIAEGTPLARSVRRPRDQEVPKTDNPRVAR
ncbi:hypothetical protein ABN034_10935 [Actinopolymorpha sp. B11F2]|uniref:hypothetical protein n=1 Tax=Actinopolymorpha sp. B11F2 TaxID=3160862 RepID=UPI0032E43B6B